MNAIQTTNLTKYYGKTRGIFDLNLTVEAGEFFGFIGPNGAGKINYHPHAAGADFPERRAVR